MISGPFRPRNDFKKSKQRKDFEDFVKSSNITTSPIEFVRQRTSLSNITSISSRYPLFRTPRTSDIGDSSSIFEDSSEESLIFENKGEFFAGVKIREKERHQTPLTQSKKNTTHLRIPTTKNKMVREVSPAKKPSHSSQEEPLRTLNNVSKPRGPPNAPVFGQPSQMESPLGRAAKDVFIQPKQRPEHHRPQVQSNHPHLHAAKEGVKKFLDPFRPRNSTQEQDEDSVVEITKPTNTTFATVRPAAQPTFGSMGGGYDRFTSTNYSGFQPANTFGSGNTVDLTSGRGSYRDPLAPEPYTYVDTAKAQEDIKALLEGAFDEDEDDKPRTRSRKKKQTAQATDLLSKLKGLHVDEEEKESLKVEEEEEEEEDDGTVEGIRVKLLPHQVEGLEWMTGRELGTRKKAVVPKGGLLADDMGLGKTLQSVSLILTNPKPTNDAELEKRKLPSSVEKCTLVVAPLSLIRQWEAEIKDKVEPSHSLRVLVHHGPQRTKRYQDLKRYDVVITTYQILVSEWGSSTDDLKVGCFGLHWYRVILDEAHTIKNRNAKSTQACYALRSIYRWCLTGTPMQNNLDELQSLIKFLRIKPYDDLKEWKDQIDRPMKNGRGDVAIKRLQHYLKIFMKRRTKEILKKDGALNPGGKPSAAGEGNKSGFRVTERKIEKVFAEFSPEERHFYTRLEQRADRSLEQMMDAQEKVSYASALVLLLRLRQACNHPKLVAGKLGKDNEALSEAATSKPDRKDKSSIDVDAIADMFGGLEVGTKKCEVCQLDLSRDLTRNGAVRCEECEGDLEVLDGKKKKKHRSKKHRSKKHRSKGKHTEKNEVSDSEEEIRVNKPKNRNVILDSDDEEEVEQKPQKLKNRPVVFDSDEEEEEEWIVSEKHRGPTNLGKAGGTDDENAEGGGDSIGPEDSDTEDDESELPSTIQPRKNVKKEVGSLDSDDESGDESESGSYSESGSGSDEDASDSESETFSEDELKMSKIASSTKIKHLLRILRKEASEHKFIVFSQFTSMLDLIEPFLRKEGIRFARYDGSMKNDMREASLNTLRNDKKCRVLLCSLKCGSLGLNLTAATRVVILEPFWNPFVEEQAIDRVHRLTQTVNVIVYKITIKETVEERILELQEKKRELANQTIEGGPKGGAGKLGMKEIMQLFRRDAETAVPVSGGADRYDNSRTKILVAPSLDEVGRGSGGGRESSQKIKMPSVMGNARERRRDEDDVYGRR